MASDALYVVVGVGSPLATAGVSHMLTLVRDRRRDAHAERDREAAAQRAADLARIERIENELRSLHDEVVTSDVLAKYVLRTDREH